MNNKNCISKEILTMKILFIAPIPPPTDGQSKASKVLLDKLIHEGHEVVIVNLSKKVIRNGALSVLRLYEIIKVLLKVFTKRSGCDIIYLSLAESILGNLRDLAIYSICNNNKKNIVIHMLGGAGMKRILSGNGLQSRVNKFFISKIGGVIVEGPVNFELFARVIDKNKIRIVPNFAEDFLFAEEGEIQQKFEDINIVNILYLSNLIYGKGYLELFEAYTNLSKEIQDQISLTFVGGFESELDKGEFLDKIHNYDNIKYLGHFIDGLEKRNLYLKSHIFCLPTYYPYEGQPISILEAYATGCVVITSSHSGIPFIFSDKENGFIVEKKSPSSITDAINKALHQKNGLISLALKNREQAFSKYRTTHFQNSIIELFSDLNSHNQ